MKKVIWKYHLKTISHQIIKLPKGSEILSLTIEDKDLCLWALVPQQTDLEERHFRIIGAGLLLDDHFTSPYKFIGSCSTAPCNIYHVFETKD